MSSKTYTKPFGKGHTSKIIVEAVKGMVIEHPSDTVRGDDYGRKHRTDDPGAPRPRDRRGPDRGRLHRGGPVMNPRLRAIRAKCSECWGHGGYIYQGHWGTRCSACNGSGQS